MAMQNVQVAEQDNMLYPVHTFSSEPLQPLFATPGLLMLQCGYAAACTALHMASETLADTVVSSIARAAITLGASGCAHHTAG